MGYWLDRQRIPVPSDGDLATYDATDGPTDLDPNQTGENPAVNWLDTLQTVADRVENHMGRVGLLADRPDPGPDAPILFFAIDGGPNDDVPVWFHNVGDDWITAGESTNAATLGGREPDQYLQIDTDAFATGTHTYGPSGGLAWGEQGAPSIVSSFDADANQLIFWDALNGDPLLILNSREGGTYTQVGRGTGPHTIEFGNNDDKRIRIVYRTTPDSVYYENENEEALWAVGTDGSARIPRGPLSVFGGITAGGPIATDSGLDVGGNVNLNGNEIERFVLETRTNDPDDPPIGRMWYRVDRDGQ